MAKQPLKSALKKTPATPTATTNTNASAKRKHTPTVSTTTNAKKNDNKRIKTAAAVDSKQKSGNNKKPATQKQQQQKKKQQAPAASKKSVTVKTPQQHKKKGASVTSGSTPAAPVIKKVVKPKKVEVVPEGATLEDFRIVAGTYENILYGIDAYWNEDLTLRLSPIFIFAAHIGCIKSLAIGGNFLASGSTDEKIQLYDLKRRKELGALLQHQGTITSLTFHNKTHMLSGSDDGKICVWRSKDWECLKIMKGHQASVHSIAIHPSGKIALSVAADHSVRLWNLLLGKQASMTRLHGEGLRVAWNPSGTGYSIMFDQEVGIYDMATAKCIRSIKPAKKTRFNTMAYYKDEYIIVGCEDKAVRVYSTATGDLVKTLLGHGNRIKGLDLVTVPFTPDHTSNKGLISRPETKMVDILTTVSSDGVILFWNMDDVVEAVKEGEDTNMKKSIGEFKTDMRVTCVSLQKGIWKNVGADVADVEVDSDDEDEVMGGQVLEEEEESEVEEDAEDEDEDDE